MLVRSGTYRLEYSHNLFESGGHLDGATTVDEHDHVSQQRVIPYPFALIFFKSETRARFFAFFPLQL